MIDRRARHRIHGSIFDIVLLELWMNGDVDESELESDALANAFSRIQARMLVVQAMLWPFDDAFAPEPDSAEADPE